MMRGLMVRGLILGLCLSAMLGCSWFPTFDDVMPDRNKEYQKSASLPDLEIPPDLSSDAVSDTLSVPEVDAKGTASYSTYQERIARRGSGERSGGDSGGEPYRAPAEEYPEDVPTPEDTTALDDSRSDDGRSDDDPDERIADEDADYSSPADEEEEASEAEPESESRSYGARTPAGGGDDEPAEEPEEDPAEETERSPPPAAVGVGQTGAGGRAELVSAGEGKKYLRVTEDFSEAWHLTGQALAKAGFTVADEDRDRGVYFVDFTGAPGAASEQGGFLSSLVFWRGDATEHEVQLTGIGEKTEVVVLDEDGNWESGPVADEILTRLETALNQAGEGTE
ncbi:MAG: outer membrane protein assembly factor BamC [Pseudomonadota bacterium]|nr:outer membrane protein assembly factor BamC [Pseudomonadota bacterium]